LETYNIEYLIPCDHLCFGAFVVTFLYRTDVICMLHFVQHYKLLCNIWKENWSLDWN